MRAKLGTKKAAHNGNRWFRGIWWAIMVYSRQSAWLDFLYQPRKEARVHRSHPVIVPDWHHSRLCTVLYTSAVFFPAPDLCKHVIGQQGVFFKTCVSSCVSNSHGLSLVSGHCEKIDSFKAQMCSCMLLGESSQNPSPSLQCLSSVHLTATSRFLPGRSSNMFSFCYQPIRLRFDPTT